MRIAAFWRMIVSFHRGHFLLFPRDQLLADLLGILYTE